MNLRLPVDMLRWIFVVVNVVLLASAGMTAVQFFSERPEKELDLVLAETDKFVVPEEVRRSVDRQTQVVVGWVKKTKPVPVKPQVEDVPTEVPTDTAEGGPLAAANWVIDGMIGSSSGTSFAYLRKDTGESAAPTPRRAGRANRRQPSRRIKPRVGAAGAGGPTTKITARSGRSFFIDEAEYFCDLVDALGGKVYYHTSIDSRQYVLSRETGESSLIVENGIRQLKGGEGDTKELDGASPVTPASRRGSIEAGKGAPKPNANTSRTRQRPNRANAAIERNRAERQAAAKRNLARQRKTAEGNSETRAALERLKESGVRGERYEQLRERIRTGEGLDEISKELQDFKGDPQRAKENNRERVRERDQRDASRSGNNSSGSQNNQPKKSGGGGR